MSLNLSSVGAEENDGGRDTAGWGCAVSTQEVPWTGKRDSVDVEISSSLA